MDVFHQYSSDEYFFPSLCRAEKERKRKREEFAENSSKNFHETARTHADVSRGAMKHDGI